MKHIVFYSGGIGSWATAKRVVKKHGKENVILLFTDTLIEDKDLYRFINESVKEMGVEYVRIADGRTPWEVFKDVKFLGNSRIAHCSHLLKQKMADNWIRKNFKPDECVLYLGIDWTEEHRTNAPKNGYLPYKVEFPMCDEPYVTKDEMIEELEKLGIRQPDLYKLGFSHNNCGGFCVRAGQGHFANLLKKKPDLYKYHENKEQEMREFLGKDVSILKRVRVEEVYDKPKYSSVEWIDWSIEDIKNKETWNDAVNRLTKGAFTRKPVTYTLTLKQLREEIESNHVDDIDFGDIGGCGCFVNYDE